MLALFVVFGGVLAALLVELLLAEAVDEVPLLLIRIGLFLGLGFFGCAAVPGRALRASVGRLPHGRDLLVAAGGGLVAFAASWLYVSLLLGWADVERTPDDHGVAELVGVLLVAPILEEWLCRGVLFFVARNAVSMRGTIVVTAALFGILHGFGSGFLLEVPHRFASGLVFGWLRARSGSLVPSILAHFLLNLLAVVAV